MVSFIGWSFFFFLFESLAVVIEWVDSGWRVVARKLSRLADMEWLQGRVRRGGWWSGCGLIFMVTLCNNFDFVGKKIVAWKGWGKEVMRIVVAGESVGRMSVAYFWRAVWTYGVEFWRCRGVGEGGGSGAYFLWWWDWVVSRFCLSLKITNCFHLRFVTFKITLKIGYGSSMNWKK